MEETTTPVIERDDAPRAALDEIDSAYPLVTVAMVAHNPGAWFDDVLRSLLAQDYPALDIVVIDAASDEPVAAAVHEIIPEATVVPLIANQGFAKNANTILDHPALGPYLLVCHDDVALAPDCIRRLVEETLRSNAGVIGPKLLDWNEPNRILHVGFGADKTGLVSDLAEPGEYDQEQHDAVRDVFAVPGAVTLLRTDLFVALGGFDDAMVVQGEDLDLCWRAHALGARVLVNPEATARHREDLTTRIPGHDNNRFARRHRIRAMLSNYGTWHSIRVVPQALAASFVNAVIALFQGRLSLIVEIVGGWTWNLRRLGAIRRRRRHLAQIRQVHDSEVRALQIPGFEGIQHWRKDRADRRADEIDETNTAAAMSAAAERRRWLQLSVLVWIGVVIVLAFGSRGLIAGGLPVFNEFAGFPDGPSSLLTEWGSTWRSTGVGTEGAPSLVHLLLGFAGIALFGQMNLVQLVATVGMLAAGAIGAYRLLQPFRSPAAQLVALITYLVAPLPYNALHSGSWSALVAYGSMPWIAKRLAVAAGIPPFGDAETPVLRRLADLLLLAFLIAAAALIEPFVAGCAIVLACGWFVGGLATRRTAGLVRLLIVAGAAVAASFVLLLPGSLEYLSADAEIDDLAGASAIGPDRHGLGELMRLATGPHGESIVGWALLVVPALALALAFGQRLAWAARSWFVVIASVGLALAQQRGTFDIALPEPEVVLAPAAVALAFASGMTAMAFLRDLRRYRFGWRQLVPLVAVAAMVASIGAGLGSAFDGRWKAVDDGYDDVLAFLDERAPAHARTFWLGDAEVLPVEGWRYDDDLSFAITHARRPTLLDQFPGPADDTTREIRDRFAATLEGASSRLGRDLAPYGIRFIVVVDANAPAPFGTIERPVDAGLVDRLREQLDLIRVEVRPGATIFENRSYIPTVSAFPPDGLRGDDIPGGAVELALPEVTSLRSYRGRVEPSDLYLAVNSDTNWELRVEGEAVARREVFGWAQAFTVAQSGRAELDHSNETSIMAMSLVQLGLWVAGIATLVLGRRRRR